MARDIHDGLGHTLTSLRIQLELALKLLEEENCAKVKELLTNCQESASASLQEVRRAVRTEDWRVYPEEGRLRLEEQKIDYKHR